MRLTRPALISPEQAARVHETARRILREIGMEVRHAEMLERLRASGFRTEGDRVFFEPDEVEEHVEEMRRLIASRTPQHGGPPGIVSWEFSEPGGPTKQRCTRLPIWCDGEQQQSTKTRP